MKKSGFTDAQIAFVLRQAEAGTEIETVCRKAGISQHTFDLYGRLFHRQMKRGSWLPRLNQRQGNHRPLTGRLQALREIIEDQYPHLAPQSQNDSRK